ncbi:type II secretion system F family protein [Rothia dentocariosa]|jgi:putative typeII /IV secretion system integral membrane protein, tadB related|uniref:type II secretion system F family protein n=1 Tax=Rothia dentocariosa TaxID=2047 RepID=UPI00145538E5|nr:type II secretion system F family protein [Rothia dentocariosa]NLR26581.1 type II secretion system F family protein [Rothia dentocariosa]
MSTILIVLAVMVCIAGLTIVTIAVATRHDTIDENTAPPGVLQQKLLNLQERIRHINTNRLVFSIIAGVILWVLLRWPIMVIIVPTIIFLSPTLFLPKDKSVDLLDDIAAWTHNLVGLISTGSHLEGALKASYSNAGDTLRPHLGKLIARLNSSWRTERALRAFAQDLHDPTADLVVASLILSARQRGQGLADALAELAKQTREEVSVRREISATQATPRTTVAIINILILGLIVAVPFIPALSAPYRSPLGQIVFAALVAFALLVLRMMRMRITPDPIPRILSDNPTHAVHPQEVRSS